jgi:hypothetical protein
MTTIYNTTITEPVYLPTDCWSEVLSFMLLYDRFQVATTNKEMLSSLRCSFTGQTINMTDTKITDAGLAHLANVEAIDLTYCDITDAGLVHLSNVKRIILSCCENITDAGMEHLLNVNEINLWGCKRVTYAGLDHLPIVTKILWWGDDNTLDTALLLSMEEKNYNMIYFNDIGGSVRDGIVDWRHLPQSVELDCTL